MFSRFKIYIDGKMIGSVKNGKAEVFNVSPGRHSIYVRGAAWSKTEELEINISAGDFREFERGIVSRYLWQLFFGWLCFLLPVFLRRLGIVTELGYLFSLAAALSMIVPFGIILLIRTFQRGTVYDLREIQGGTPDPSR